MRVEKVVSKFEAVRVRLFPLISKRKLSKIGSVFVLLLIPLLLGVGIGVLNQVMRSKQLRV